PSDGGQSTKTNEYAEDASASDCARYRSPSRLRESSTTAPASSGLDGTSSSEEVPFARSPSPEVAFACGSRSTTRVRSPASARQAARLIAVVVLPTPP